MTIRRRRSTRSARTPRPSSPEMRTWGSTSSPGTSIAMARSTDSNGLSDRPSAWAATRLRRAEPGPRAAAAIARSRATGKPSRSAESATASASSNGSRRPHIASVVVAFVASPSTCVSSRSVHVSVMRVRRASLIRRSLGTATWGTAGTTLTFQPWARAAETRHTWPVTMSASSVPSWTPGTAYRPLLTLTSSPAASADSSARREVRRTSRSRVATPPRTGIRSEISIHPACVQRRADRIVLHRSVVRTEQTRRGGSSRGRTRP